MRRESVFLLVFLIVLVASSPTALGVQRVETFGTIYIRADGSIDPPDASISTVDNVTYTLTGNITSAADGIVIERNSMMLDGAGFSLQGPEVMIGADTGVDLSYVNNVTIENVAISGSQEAFSSTTRVVTSFLETT